MYALISRVTSVRAICTPGCFPKNKASSCVIVVGLTNPLGARLTFLFFRRIDAFAIFFISRFAFFSRTLKSVLSLETKFPKSCNFATKSENSVFCRTSTDCRTGSGTTTALKTSTFTLLADLGLDEPFSTFARFSCTCAGACTFTSSTTTGVFLDLMVGVCGWVTLVLVADFTVSDLVRCILILYNSISF